MLVSRDEPTEGLWLQLFDMTEPGLADVIEPGLVGAAGPGLVDVTEPGLVEGAELAVPAIVDVGGEAIVAEAGKPVFEPGVEVVPEPGRALVPGDHMARLVVVQHSRPVAHILGLVRGFEIVRKVELGQPEPEYGIGWLELKLVLEQPHGP